MARRTAAQIRRPGFAAQLAVLLGRDLGRSLKRLDLLLGSLLLLMGTLLLLAFASKKPAADLAAPGLWVGLLLASSLLASSLYEEERAHGFLDALLAGPVAPEALFGAKLLRAWLSLAGLALAGHLLAALLFGAGPPASYLLAGATDLLGSLGLAALAALFGTRAHLPGGTWILTAASMPLAVPLVVACGRITQLLHAGPATGISTWLGLLAAADLLLLVAGLWAAPSLLGP